MKNNKDDSKLPPEGGNLEESFDDDLRSEEFYLDHDEEENVMRALPTRICPECNATDPSCPICAGEGEIPDVDSYNEFMDSLREPDEDF